MRQQTKTMPMLRIESLACTRGERVLFSDVCFQLRSGCMLVVTGDNGAGKTTLLRTIVGLTPPDSGEVTWNGRRLGAAGEEFRRELVYCGHLDSVKGDLTASENLRAAAALRGGGIRVEQATAGLAAVGLASFAQLPARSLSQGQRRRLALCRLAVADVVLWVLDEPLASLDTAASSWFAHALDSHLERGGMAVVATHHPLPIRAAVNVLRLTHD